MSDESQAATAAEPEYRRRRDAARADEARAEAQAGRLGTARLLTFFAAVGLAIACGIWGLSWQVLWAPAAIFFVLVVLNTRANRVRFRAGQVAAIHDRGLARLEDRWVGQGNQETRFRPDDHEFADDLDLFGEGSLFELLCTARTGAGEECLARWLLEPAKPAEVRARQAAVEELRPDVDLRERLARVGGEVSSALDRAAATAWGSAPRVLASKVLPWVVRILGLASAVLFVGWSFFGWPGLPLFALLAAQFLVTLPVQGRVGQVLEDADQPSQDLVLLGRLLAVLERGGFRAPWLLDLEESVEGGGVSPSQSIAKLTRLMDFVDARRNQIFLPISWLLCLGTQLAYSLESWRARYGKDLVKWVEAVGSFEAINALAGYAYEHADDPFPEICDDGARFDGEALGHPLLAAEVCVRNDLDLCAPPTDAVPQALLVSGSNMSGKSTMLRTVGVNTVLALAGAPVRAQRLSLSSLAVGASIRIHDSLRAGESRFYAEIARLRRVVDIAKRGGAALFLLDEVLHGTNSHDRRIGAAAVIRTLLDEGAIGLVTTHDLALAEVADKDARMRNVHFEDQLVDGRMQFDYRLHPGVVTHSNAIELMRSVGLEV